LSNTAKNFDILAASLSVLCNYFDRSTKFSDLYPTKILDLSAKSFFLCKLSSICYLFIFYRAQQRL